MTTIVKVDDIVAYESVITAGDSIITDDFDKMMKLPGDAIAVYAGCLTSAQYLQSLDLGEFGWAEPPVTPKKIAKLLHEVSAIVKTQGPFAPTWVWYGTGWAVLPEKGVYGLGSGGDYAVGAAYALLDASFEYDAHTVAVKAVAAAMKVDVYSGGTIRTLHL